jgi:peroxiredoxin
VRRDLLAHERSQQQRTTNNTNINKTEAIKFETTHLHLQQHPNTLAHKTSNPQHIMRFFGAITLLVVLNNGIVNGLSGVPVITRGAKVPNTDMHWGFNPVHKVNIPEYTAQQSVLIVGCAGAFTPTASNIQVPSFLEHQDELKQLGIENVIIYACNDGAVMSIWNSKQVEAYGKSNTLVTFMGDPYGDFTKACGMEMPDQIELGMIGRCKPFVLHVVNNVVRSVAVSGNEGDPTGDKNPEATCAPAIIEAIKASMSMMEALAPQNNNNNKGAEQEMFPQINGVWRGSAGARFTYA